MATQVKFRGGTTAQHAVFLGANKEITVDTTKKTAVVHDGVTLGGHPLAREQDLLAAQAALAQKLPLAGGTLSGDLYVAPDTATGGGSIIAGTAIHAGYFEVRNADQTRKAYIGWGVKTEPVLFNAENGCPGFQFNQPIVSPNQTAFVSVLSANGLTPTANTSIVVSTANGYSLSDTVNRGSNWNAANGRFTATIAGLYQINFSQLFWTGAGYIQLFIRRNGVTHSYAYADNSATPHEYVSVTEPIGLNVGDYIEFHVYSNTTTSYLHGGGYGVFSGFLIG